MHGARNFHDCAEHSKSLSVCAETMGKSREGAEGRVVWLHEGGACHDFWPACSGKQKIILSGAGWAQRADGGVHAQIAVPRVQ
jgi:hypothetical protein